MGELSRIWAFYVVYNEADFIEKSLSSILPFVDGVVMVDGAYAHYPHTNYLSTDGTLEIAERVCRDSEKSIFTFKPSRAFTNEVDKRNFMFETDIIKEDDWIFIIDGDEQVSVIGNAFNKMADDIRNNRFEGFRIKTVHIDRYPILILRWGNPRIIRKKKGLKYFLNHYTIIDADGKNFFTTGKFKDVEIHLIQRNKLHDEDKQKRKTEYWRNRVEYLFEDKKCRCGECEHVFSLRAREMIKCPKCNSGLIENPESFTRNQ